jgi:hypothetical protein
MAAATAAARPGPTAPAAGEAAFGAAEVEIATRTHAIAARTNGTDNGRRAGFPDEVRGNHS